MTDDLCKYFSKDANKHFHIKKIHKASLSQVQGSGPLNLQYKYICPN